MYTANSINLVFILSISWSISCFKTSRSIEKFAVKKEIENYLKVNMYNHCCIVCVLSTKLQEAYLYKSNTINVVKIASSRVKIPFAQSLKYVFIEINKLFAHTDMPRIHISLKLLH